MLRCDCARCVAQLRQGTPSRFNASAVNLQAMALANSVIVAVSSQEFITVSPQHHLMPLCSEMLLSGKSRSRESLVLDTVILLMCAIFRLNDAINRNNILVLQCLIIYVRINSNKTEVVIL